MKTIHLTKGMVAVVDDADYGRISGFKWYAHRPSHKRGEKVVFHAARRAVGTRKMVFMHREILGASPGVQVDHRDGDGLNNQRHNLRLSTHSQNQRNRGANRNNKSGFKGVSWSQSNQHWQASITADKKQMHLGFFETAQAAHEAYCMACKKFHGEFGRTG
jgi:hypothetical protein